VPNGVAEAFLLHQLL
jgi:ATP sulfurylase